MIQSDVRLSASQIIEPMIQLACCSKSHRIIVAGSKSREPYRKRNFAVIS
jgi:hypothetical protein